MQAFNRVNCSHVIMLKEEKDVGNIVTAFPQLKYVLIFNHITR